jgi:hypothetical protein
MRLPSPRGPISRFVIEALSHPAHEIGALHLNEADDPLTGDDVPLALYVMYELHYRSWDGVDDDWEWDPSLLRLRAGLEARMRRALLLAVPAPPPEDDVAAQITRMVEADDGPSLSRYLARQGTLDQFREFVQHRSAYHLKEADPHTWAIPRLADGPKAALVEIQGDEYGGGRPEWMHAALFARAMRALDLDDTYGAYVDRLPGATLAMVNMMSLFGLHRSSRGATVGHLAVLEMTSSEPMRRYGAALRRLGLGDDATTFYDEHVEADAVHEQIAAHDLAGGLARDEPAVARDIVFGAAAVIALEAAFARRLLDAWGAGASSLRRVEPSPLTRTGSLAGVPV